MALIGLFTFSGAIAQEKGDIRAGLGLAFGTKAGVDESGTKGALGITPSVEYMFKENMSGAISYDIFFKSEVSVDDGLGGSVSTSLKLSSLNLDYRYYFMTGETQIYGIAGLAFITAKAELEFLGTPISESNTETKLNLGIGGFFELSDNIGAIGQLKFQTGTEQVVLNAGLAYKF